MKQFKKVKKIHFVGIGGAGMIGIARVLSKKDIRFQVPMLLIQMI